MSNTQNHNWLGLDNLSDCAGNIAYWLSQVSTPGLGATSFQKRTTASSAAINNVETLLLNVPIIPGTNTLNPPQPGTLAVGSRIRVTLNGTDTNTVANATTIGLRMGILGTVSDAAVATWVTPVSGTTGTNVPFQIVIDITVQTLGASGTAFSTAVINSPATGIIGALTNTVVSSAAAITAMPTTTATFLDITAVTAATTTTNTFTNCTVEIFP